MNNQPTVSIAIPTYNAANNIRQLLNSLIRQKAKIKSIVVYSDCSTDNTIKEIVKVKSKKIILIKGAKRLGFAGVFKKISKQVNTDVLLLLNDDIKITDNKFVSKIIKPFEKVGAVGLVSGNPQPIRAKTFMEKAITSTFRAFEKSRYSFRAGENQFTCDGKVLCLSKIFIKKLKLPKNLKRVGNLDAFLYFSCLENKYRYIHVKKAVVFFKCPTSVSDYLKWTVRNNADKPLMVKMFGKKVKSEYRLLNAQHLKNLFVEFIKNPAGCTVIFFLHFYVTFKSRGYSKNFPILWDIVESTKSI